MPLLLIKTTEEKDYDLAIAKKITEIAMEELGLVESDVAVKFEKSAKRHIDLYLYDKKQYPYQKERTVDVFDQLSKEIALTTEKITGKKFIIETHLILKERCFRAGKSRF